MAFEVGARLGPYEITAPIGAGGMGQIYRARDTRLDRTVAIKVLTGELSTDPESRQRFEQEARAIAALNDPHICTIHDVGRDGELDYLVLEYLEGETLAERLKRTGALAIGEALAIATQIAGALAQAHRAGIVHRDLKPGNVMLLKSGSLKLLDFGLASRHVARSRAVDATVTTATVGPSLVATRAPSATVSSGFSGTVQYMAPEQIEGDPGDPRTDIFAFGCVLYEMLAGRRAFEGGTVMTAIAAIMNTEPPPIAALDSAQPLLDYVLRRCLEKDRERRWQSIADVATALRWVVDHPHAPVAVAAPAPAARLPLARYARLLIAFGIIIALALTNAAVRAIRQIGRAAAAPQLPVLQLEITTPPTDDPSAALSPDGRQVAYIANKDRVPLLWVRALDNGEARALPGTDGASYPFWSPDNRSLGFFAGDRLKRVEIAGGTPVVITEARSARGGAWGPDGTILFAPGVNAPIMRVPARGGQVAPVTAKEDAGPSHRWPQFLPDGKRFLFSSSLGTADTNGVYIGSLDGAKSVRILPDDGIGRFAPPDRLVTVFRGALQAYRFDPKSGRVQGDASMLAQGFSDAATAGVFGSSDNGILAYRSGVAQRRQLAWVNRRGELLRTVGEPAGNSMGSPELSPDEQSVVMFLHPGTGADNDVWVTELARNISRPLTSGPPADAHPIWAPDGRRVVFNGSRTGQPGPAVVASAGGPAQPLFHGMVPGLALSYTRDGRFLLLRRDDGATGVDLVAVSPADEKTIPVTQLPGDELEGQFSPDGRWVAFVSSESGQAEVFVQAFPSGDGRTQVSTMGGAQVRWSADGREIFYIAPDGRMMSVSLSAQGSAPSLALPVPLFQTHLATGVNVIGNKAQYAVARDGRFLLNTAVESPSAPIVLLVNWTRKLAR